jgi:hypothetical protein
LVVPVNGVCDRAKRSVGHAPSIVMLAGSVHACRSVIAARPVVSGRPVY